MECIEIRKLLSEAALGDLDAEPARLVAEHVKACDPCRAAQASLASTIAAVRGVSEVVPSAERREAAVRAMVREQAAPPRRSRLPWAAAAAVLLAVAGAFLAFRAERGFEFRAAQVAGRVEVIDRATGLCHPIAEGDAVRAGDHLVTQPGAFVLLDLGTGALHVESDTSLDFISSRKIVLARGRVTADLHASRDLVLSDTANNTVTLRAGRAAISLGVVKGVVMAYSKDKDGRESPGSLREEVSLRLVVRVTDGEADLDGSHRQRLRVVGGQKGTFDFGGQPTVDR